MILRNPMCRDRNQRGQVLVIAVLGLTVLLGFAGLIVDVGYLYATRRSMQTAADAAAIAGSNMLLGTQSSNYQQAAKDVATLNGFTDGQNGVTVTVGPPASPPNPATGQYVEVDVSKPVSTYFLRVIGYSTINVDTKAVAGTVNSPNCIYALDPSSNSAIGFNGAANFTASCGMIDDSSSGSAFSVTGAGVITASSIGVVGGVSKSGAIILNPTPVTGVAAVADPLASIPAPSIGSCVATLPTVPITMACNLTNGLSCTGAGNITLSPGTYCGGISITNSAVNLTLQPGTYVLEGGGLTITGAATISGTGVTIYNTSGGGHAYQGINITGATSDSLSAPTSGPLEGMLFFQDRTISSATAAANPNVINGASSAKFEGTLYFPTTALTYNGASGAAYTIVVADTINFNGASAGSVGNNYSSLADGSPLRSTTLYQ